MIHDPSRDDNTYHVLTGSGVNITAVLDGFTVSAGYARRLPEDPHSLEHYQRGGGMYNESGNPSLVNCTFRHNTAGHGGALYNYLSSPRIESRAFNENWSLSGVGSDCGGGAILNNQSSPRIAESRFNTNWTQYHGGGVLNYDASNASFIGCWFISNSAGWYGGGMSNMESDPVLVGCTFRRNNAMLGGGIECIWSSPLVVECDISDNTAVGYLARGGGICCGCGSEPIIRKCVLSGNVALGSGIGEGGGICYEGCTGWPRNTNINGCVITGNSASHRGGGIYCSNYNARVENCTLVGNSSRWGGGVWLYFVTSATIMRNCILWHNRADGIYDEKAQIEIGYGDIVNSHNCIENSSGTFGGIGNIGNDPCFAEPGYWDSNGTLEDVSDDSWIDGNYHLKSQSGRWDPKTQSWVKDDITSLCVDAGDPSSPIGLEPFPNGGRINMGAYGGTAEASKSYFGEPICETIVAGDINGDCKVDFSDLAFIAIHWLDHQIGQASNPNPPDGAIDISTRFDGVLEWAAGANAISYDVFLGTDRTAVADASTDSTTYYGNQLNTKYGGWGLFKPSTTYYWRIDEIGYLGRTIGKVWSFTTGND